MKKDFFKQVLFGSRRKGGKIWESFRKRFPEMAGLFSRFRNGSELAIYLQKLEASIVIDVVVPRLKSELKGRPFLTLHDAVFCMQSDAEQVRCVLSSECEWKIGVAPAVKIKYLTND